MNLKDYDVRYQRARARWSNLNQRMTIVSRSMSQDDNINGDAQFLNLPTQYQRRQSGISIPLINDNVEQLERVMVNKQRLT